MKILASQKFKNEMSSGKLGRHIHLEDLADRLGHLTSESIKKDPNIHRLQRANEEIYVLRFRGLRVFLTISEGNVIVLSAMEHG